MLFWLMLACGASAPTPSVELQDEPAQAAHHEGAHHEEAEAHGKHGEHGHPKAEHANHRFDDVEKWVKVFDDPERDAWQKPDVVVGALALEPGMTVADIGAGTGYFNAHLAKAVGDSGKVIAQDIEETLVAHMKDRAAKEGTPQVEARLAPMDASGLTEKEVDRVLLVDVYHHIGDRTAYFTDVRNALKDGGKMVIVDLTKEAPFGPPKSERLTAEEVEVELAAAGWALESTSEGLPHQYILVFAPKQ